MSYAAIREKLHPAGPARDAPRMILVGVWMREEPVDRVCQSPHTFELLEYHPGLTTGAAASRHCRQCTLDHCEHSLDALHGELERQRPAFCEADVQQREPIVSTLKKGDRHLVGDETTQQVTVRRIPSAEANYRHGLDLRHVVPVAVDVGLLVLTNAPPWALPALPIRSQFAHLVLRDFLNEGWTISGILRGGNGWHREFLESRRSVVITMPHEPACWLHT